MKRAQLSRRDFLKGLALTGAGLVVGGGLWRSRRSLAALLAGSQSAIDQAIKAHKAGQLTDAQAQATVEAYMAPTTTPGQPKVIHVRDTDATSWNGSSNYYWQYVNQSVVTAMVDQGVMALTGTSTRADAWRALLPNYTAGKVAIKINFNNSGNGNIIDALYQPINAIIQGLTAIGVALSDIVIFDAVRPIPTYFRNGCTAGVTFCEVGDTDFPTPISFSRPGIPAQYLARVVTEAAYLINVPILKSHSITGVTLGFKHHFGSINQCSQLHDYVDPNNGTYYRSDHNPLVDIYLNPHIRNKTVLIVGDALFGSKDNTNSVPIPWNLFDGFPESLLFATDPVAMDCVMFDLLAEEPAYYAWDEAAEYLLLAAAAGLGTYDHVAHPWTSGGYTHITYQKVIL